MSEEAVSDLWPTSWPHGHSTWRPNGPLLRACLVKLDDQKHVFCFNMHHIVSDGWSIGVLVKEIVCSLRGLLTGIGTTPCHPCVSSTGTTQPGRTGYSKTSLSNSSAATGTKHWPESCRYSTCPPTGRARRLKPTTGKPLIRSLDSAKRTAGIKNLANSEKTSLFITLFRPW